MPRKSSCHVISQSQDSSLRSGGQGRQVKSKGRRQQSHRPCLHSIQPWFLLPQAGIREWLHVPEEWSDLHFGAFMRMARRHRQAMQTTAPNGEEPLRPCGANKLQRVFQSSPSIFTVNSLLFFHPAVPSHSQSAWPHPPHTVFFYPTGFFSVYPPPPPCDLYPNWVFMPFSSPPLFNRFFV